MEEWRDIVGYEGLYQVSNYGRVKSIARSYRHNDKILKQDLKSNGYWQVHLCRNSKSKWHHVHRLVAMAFITKADGCDIVNHIDNNRQNNHVINLEWTTMKDNIQHAAKQGRMHGQEYWKRQRAEHGQDIHKEMV